MTTIEKYGTCDKGIMVEKRHNLRELNADQFCLKVLGVISNIPSTFRFFPKSP